MRQLKHGDQIAVMGKVDDIPSFLLTFFGQVVDTYYHHGIYDKENMEVIDFYGENKENAKPQKRDFTEFFARHEELYLVVYEDGEQCLPVDETMKMAEDAVNKPSSWPGYHIIANNCESFATYLKTGVAYSKQVLDAATRLAKKTGVVAATASISSLAIGPALGSVGGSLTVPFVSGKRFHAKSKTN